MRKSGSNRMILYAAVLTAVFSLAFFLGRNTVTYEAAVSVQRPADAERAALVSLPEEDTALPNAVPEEGTADLTSVQEEPAVPVRTNPSAVDLNRATVEELMTLPGIGETLAQRIVEYRNSVGFFSAPEQIMDVEGIGNGIYEKIRDQITVEEPQ